MTQPRRSPTADGRLADPRPGKTLVELVVVMVIVATVLLLVGRVVIGLLRAEDRATQTLLVGRAQDRVASRLRADVRAATSATVDEVADGPAIVTLSLPDGSAVAYTVSAEGIERVVSRDGKRVAGDTFRLPERSPRFETVEHGAATFLVLSVVPNDPRGGETSSSPGRPVWRTEVRLPTGENAPANEGAAR